MVTREAMYLYVGVSITATSCLRRAGLEAITTRHFGISARLEERGRAGSGGEGKGGEARTPWISVNPCLAAKLCRAETFLVQQARPATANFLFMNNTICEFFARANLRGLVV